MISEKSIRDREIIKIKLCASIHGLEGGRLNQFCTWARNEIEANPYSESDWSKMMKQFIDLYYTQPFNTDFKAKLND